MDKVAKYTTKGGERWDNVAAFAYGNPMLIKELIAANPNVPKSDVLPQGIVMNIPIISTAESNNLDLPPWKR